MELSDLDELLAHQAPEPFGYLGTRHDHWRESYFFIAHPRDRLGDAIVLTMAAFPQRAKMESMQWARVGGALVGNRTERAIEGDLERTEVPPAKVKLIRPFAELHIESDPALGPIGFDLTFRARTRAYALRRGTMSSGDDVVWDQRHMFQSGCFTGTYTCDGTTYEVDDWWGQRDHSWGIRDHGRCPLWMWFQVQLPDGFLGVWHWELANGARVFTDGCWAPSDGGKPVPLTDFAHAVEWVGANGEAVGYGRNGEGVVGVRGEAIFTLAGRRRVVVTGEGRFDFPYEGLRRGGLNQVVVTTNDGRSGTAIWEITGAHHHRYFPDTEIPAGLPN